MKLDASAREAALTGEPVPVEIMTAAPVAALLAALRVRGVRYCHWKSNIRLPESLVRR